MSAGSFTTSRYESNSGSVYRIRVQPETTTAEIATIANLPTESPIDQEVSAKASGGKREIGMIARTVTLRFTETAPAGYSGEDVTIPVLTSTAYDAWTTPASQTGTYLGSEVIVVSQSAERKR